MPTKTWAEMTDQERNAALAEKLGWQVETECYEVPTKVWAAPERVWAVVGRFHPQTWEGMGLVVEAMAEKGFRRTVDHLANGDLIANFSNDETDYFVFSYKHNEPAATAEAAWRALGGE